MIDITSQSQFTLLTLYCKNVVSEKAKKTNRIYSTTCSYNQYIKYSSQRRRINKAIFDSNAFSHISFVVSLAPVAHGAAVYQTTQSIRRNTANQKRAQPHGITTTSDVQ